MFQYFRNIQIKSLVFTNFRRTNYTTCNLETLRQSRNNTNRKELLQYNLKFCYNFKLNNFRHYHLLSNRELCDSIACSKVLANKNRLGNSQLFISQAFSNKDPDNEEKILNEAKEIERITSRFPQPKNVLHNFYDVISQEVLSNSYKVNPLYKMQTYMKKEKMPSYWSCTYNLKWPEEIKIQAIAMTKKEASHRAACKALSYLLKSGKISSYGHPLLYDKETVKRITKESHFSIILNDSEKEQLNNIYKVFDKNILPSINVDKIKRNNIFEIDNNNETSDYDDLRNWSFNEKTSPRSTNLYQAKETVKLPVQDHREEFENLLTNNRVIIVRGEPGCGKSTRIPQYVLEHFVTSTQSTNARVIVTQPRRIAAISLAERVAQERNERVGNVVGYQVRLNTMFNPQTGRILYCTTGILLRQIQADPNLSRCTHIILDEAHERDVNTDLLMNLMRQALDRNPNLKLIIMSATIDMGLFQKYFNNPPVLNIPAFAYPVKAHFLNDIKLDLTRTEELWNKFDRTGLVFEDIAKVIKWIHKNKPEGAILCFLPGWEEIIKIKQLLMNDLSSSSTSVVTIHSKLSQDEQKKIFRKPPRGVRKIILATNIAETSVTVDDVVYIVDTGIHKESRFDTDKGIMCIDNHRISQSSMSQRKGRAGRVQPGESFHIYPEYSYKELLQFSLPEILRTSLTKIVLDAKVYSHNMNSANFFSHLPTPPKDETVKKAVEDLQDLEMLDADENLTPLGRVVSDFQLPPKLSKAMIHSVIYKCVIPIVDIATLFSFDSNMFVGTLTEKEGIHRTKANFCKDSDHIAIMILFEQWANMMNNNEFHEAALYCTRHNLVPQKLNTLKQLKDIHFEYLDKYLKNALELSDDFSVNKEFIKGVLLSGVGTVLLKRNWDMVKGRIKKKSVFITRNNQKATITSDSVNYKRNDYESPFLVYINETRSEMRRSTLIRETSVIQPLTFMLFKNSKLTFQEVSDNNNTDISDPVLIKLEGTTFKVLCNRDEAHLIQNCKNALKTMENYFIYQLTKGGEENEDILSKWNSILYMLNSILKAKAIK